MKSRRSKNVDAVALIATPSLRPANANQLAEDPTAFVLDVDPKTVVKTIAAGICMAGIQLLTQHRGRSVPPAKNGTDVLTADEVAEFLRLDRKTVYDYAGRGEIPCQRLGKRILFSRTALVSWLTSCCKGSSEGS
jgi:excisionase family DNA binding protein